MRLPRTTAHRLAWLAALAILWAALAPLASHAMRQGADPLWAALCSAGKAPAVDVLRGAPDPGEGLDHHLLQHCPYCALHANTLGAPPPSAPAFAAPAAVHAPPESVAATPRPALRWIAAQPRAPPLLDLILH